MEMIFRPKWPTVNFQNWRHETVDKSLPPCSPTQSHIIIEGDRQWAWSSGVRSWGDNGRLRSPGRWPKSWFAKSGARFVLFLIDWNHKCWTVHHLLVCNYGGFANSSLLLSTSSPVRETLDYTLHGPSAWQRGAPIQIFGKSVKLPSHF